MRLLAPALALCIPLAACSDSRMKFVEKSVRDGSKGLYEVVSIKKTGGRRSPTVSPEFEIDFEGQARILKDFEVRPLPADGGFGGMEWIEYQDNLSLLGLFDPGSYRAGETRPFRSKCVLMHTKEFGTLCRTIARDTAGAY